MPSTRNVPTYNPAFLAANSVRPSRRPLGEPRDSKTIAPYCGLGGFVTCPGFFPRPVQLASRVSLRLCRGFVAILGSRLCRRSLGRRSLRARLCWLAAGSPFSSRVSAEPELPLRLRRRAPLFAEPPPVCCCGLAAVLGRRRTPRVRLSARRKPTIMVSDWTHKSLILA